MLRVIIKRGAGVEKATIVAAAVPRCLARRVIGLRLAKLARGGAAALAEMNRMVSEKADAALEAQHRAAKSMLIGNSSQIPARTLALYRRKMRANRRRLGAAKGRRRVR